MVGGWGTLSFFTKHYDRLMRPMEQGLFRDIRKKLLNHAKGDILEIGAGTGINFPLYVQGEVTAIEPVAAMRQQAKPRIELAKVPIHMLEGDAQALPFEAGRFDTIVGTLVLCTVPDPKLALQEIHRVGKSGATLLLFEHIRLESRWLGGLQDVLTPVWRKVCDGCHLNRDTPRLVEEAGMELMRIRPVHGKLFVSIEARIP